MSKRMYHPCHKLSVPSAKIFWCRHCMQMFEDAISRWKHSKICRGIPGIKQKDQDGQVIQMYVKPDKVSYTSNVVPGQTIFHKPQVKKASADLKCVICLTKFSSLYDMREHVKYPCQRAYNRVPPESEDSEDEDSASSLKIRRVELLESNINSSTALAVLAEASKHVESLSYQGEHVLETAGQAGVQLFGQSVDNKSSVCITPAYEHYPTVAVKSIKNGPIVRTDLEPVVIAIQSEDGQDIPETSLDVNTIQNCVRESIVGLPIGQIIQVEINIQDKKVRQFCVGANDQLHPLEDIVYTRPHKEEHPGFVVSSDVTLETEVDCQPVLTEVVVPALTSTGTQVPSKPVAPQPQVVQELTPQGHIVTDFQQQVQPQSQVVTEVQRQSIAVSEFQSQIQQQVQHNNQLVTEIQPQNKVISTVQPHLQPQVVEQVATEGLLTEVVLEEVYTVSETNICSSPQITQLASSAIPIPQSAVTVISQGNGANQNVISQTDSANQIVVQPIQPIPAQSLSLTSTLHRLLESGVGNPSLLKPVHKPPNQGASLISRNAETVFSVRRVPDSQSTVGNQPQVQIIEVTQPPGVSVRTTSELLSHLTNTADVSLNVF